MSDQPFHKILSDFRAEMESCAAQHHFPDLTSFDALCDELDLLRKAGKAVDAIRDKLNAMLVVMDYAKRLPTKREPPATWTDIDENNWKDKINEMRKWWDNDRKR